MQSVSCYCSRCVRLLQRDLFIIFRWKASKADEHFQPTRRTFRPRVSNKFHFSRSSIKINFPCRCDSISTVFVSIAACCASGLGNHPNVMFLSCISAVVLFYIAHWQTYITGTLRFGKFDVTEAQVCIIGIHSMTFLLGVDAWHTKIAGVELWFLMAAFSLTTAFFVLVNFVRILHKGGIGKNGSTVAGTSIISPILPFILVIIPEYIISEKSKSGLYVNHPVLYMLMFGLLAAKVSCRLVIAHMSKSEMNYFDSGLIGPLILFFNQYFNEFIPEYCVLWLAFAWVTFDLCWYSMHVCLEMCDHLNIQLFKIPYPPKVATAKAPSIRK